MSQISRRGNWLAPTTSIFGRPIAHYQHETSSSSSSSSSFAGDMMLLWRRMEVKASNRSSTMIMEHSFAWALVLSSYLDGRRCGCGSPSRRCEYGLQTLKAPRLGSMLRYRASTLTSHATSPSQPASQPFRQPTGKQAEYPDRATLFLVLIHHVCLAQHG